MQGILQSYDVRFLGKLEAVEEVLSVADLFLMPSEKESFGLAALEAMACGIPCVTSNAGGLTEIVQHGVSGFACGVGEIDQMAEFGVRLLSDPNTWQQFSSEARKRAELFQLEHIVPQYEAYYQKVLNGEVLPAAPVLKS